MRPANMIRVPNERQTWQEQNELWGKKRARYTKTQVCFYVIEDCRLQEQHDYPNDSRGGVVLVRPHLPE